MTNNFYLDKLVEQAQEQEANLHIFARSGQIGKLDKRTVRYYSGLGLLDAPVKLEGRKAIYTQKHLVQLLLIRKLSSEGNTLAAIQSDIFGKSLEDLKDILNVKIKTSHTEKNIVETTSKKNTEKKHSTDFWKLPTPKVETSVQENITIVVGEFSLSLPSSKQLTEKEKEEIVAFLKKLADSSLKRPNDDNTKVSPIKTWPNFPPFVPSYPPYTPRPTPPCQPYFPPTNIPHWPLGPIGAPNWQKPITLYSSSHDNSNTNAVIFTDESKNIKTPTKEDQQEKEGK